MDSRLWSRAFNGRTGLACLAGLTWALSFPTSNVAGFAWLAPGLMALSALGCAHGTALRLGYLAGLVHFLISLRWLLHIPFPAGAIAGWIALSAYCAVYPAIWLWICLRCLPAVARTPASASQAVDGPDPCPWRSPLGGLSLLQRIGWALLSATAWVALEMILARLFSGFPWNPIGVSQYRQFPLIQIADLTGVYGVSFLVVWGSMALVCAALEAAHRWAHPGASRTSQGPPLPGHRELLRPYLLSFRLPCVSDLALPLVALIGVSVAGVMRLSLPASSAREIEIALVQPSIPQKLIFDPRETTNRFNALMELSRLALAAHPDLLVWPEASLPGVTEEHFRALTNLIASHRVWMVFGADDVEPSPDGPEGTPRYYNSAFLFGPDGRFVDTYRKQQLVIFGEYIPLERILPVLKHLTPIGASFTPGPGPVAFVLDGPSAKISVLICFEDVFPHLVRRAVGADTDFLLNLTNDDWFGESAAQWQHAANAVFRAIESGCPLVRCTNNGITCWIDSRGRMRGLDSGPHGDVYGPGFRILRLDLPAEGATRRPTFYRRHGDVFGWTCVLLTAMALAFGLLPRRPRCSIDANNTARPGASRGPESQDPTAGSAVPSSHP